MPKGRAQGKATPRRYSPQEKATAVRMVRALRVKLGTEYGAERGRVQCAALQIAASTRHAAKSRQKSARAARDTAGAVLDVAKQLPQHR